MSWEQWETEGEPWFEDSQALPDVDCSAYARLLGPDDVRVTDPEDPAGAWCRACDAEPAGRAAGLLERYAEIEEGAGP